MKTALIAAACLALALTSGATAATLITGHQVKDGSLTGRDIRNGSIKGKDLARSARGLRGPAGPAGQTGPQGAPAPPLHPTTATDASLIKPGEAFAARAQCPDSSPYAIGGGYRFTLVSGATPPDMEPVVMRSEQFEGHAWNVAARNDGTETLVLTVTVTCVTAA